LSPVVAVAQGPEGLSLLSLTAQNDGKSYHRVQEMLGSWRAGPLSQTVERHFFEWPFGGFYLFLVQTPHDSQRIATFAGADESALFQRLDGIAIGG
jgi:hypothetical protein